MLLFFLVTALRSAPLPTGTGSQKQKGKPEPGGKRGARARRLAQLLGLSISSCSTHWGLKIDEPDHQVSQKGVEGGG